MLPNIQQMHQKPPPYQPPPPSSPYEGVYYDSQTHSKQRYESFPRYEQKVDHRNDEYPMYQNQPKK